MIIKMLTDGRPDVWKALLASVSRQKYRTGVSEGFEFDARRQAALKEQRDASDRGIRLVSFRDKSFPPDISGILNPSALLYVQGRWPVPTPSVAIVGSRRPTQFGKKSCHKAARKLASHGWTIVSGLAAGCDTAAHLGALEMQGVTVAVLGNGLGSVYPSANARLARRIVLRGGALVSEQSLYTRANGETLVMRNRLQSALSRAVFVGDVSIDSGTFKTIEFARSEQKPVFSFMPPNDLMSSPPINGLRYLIRKRWVTPVSHGQLSKFEAILRMKSDVQLLH